MTELQVLHFVQMLRASEAGLLAGLFPSPAFGTRRIQSAIRKAAIKSVQGECRTKMLAFLYDRTEAADAVGVNITQEI